MRPRSTQRRIGAGLMMGALIGAVLAGAPALAAQEEGTEAEAPVEAKALLTHPINDAVPATLFSGFPPQVVCVVFQQACPEELEPVRDPISGVLKEVEANEQTSPIQPANPDGLTMTFLGGSPRYSSAVKVELPSIPEKEEFDEFALTFPQGDPSFSFDSPAFRRVVMAMIQTAGSQDPAVFEEQMRKLQDEEPFTEPLIGIEACPLLVEIPEDATAPQSAPISSVSEENADGELQPAVDCLFGANGQFDEDAGTWTFNLKSAANAWAAFDPNEPDDPTTLEYHGILLRPTGAPNLAFGDPDTSTNAQVVLDVSEAPRVTYASSEPATVTTFAPGPAMDDTASDSDSGASTGTAPSSTSSTPQSSSPRSSSSVSTPPPTSSGGGTTSSPSVPNAEVAPPVGAPDAGQNEPVALDSEPAGQPSSGPWAWLLLPVFAGGAWLTARSLTQPIPVAASAAGNGRGGALTRLVETSPAT